MLSFPLVLLSIFAVLGASATRAQTTPSLPKIPMINPKPVSSTDAASPSALTLRAVGQVGDQVVSSRQAILSGVVEQWLYAIKDRPSDMLRKKEKESWFLDIDSPAFREQVSRVMIDLMINMEAENFAVAEVDQLELQKLSTRLMIDFATLAEWKRWSPQISEIQIILKRKIRSRAFLEFKSEGSTAMVSDEEARAYFEANRAKFGPYPFEQFKNNIKEVVSRDRVDARLKDWFELLKKKYRTRFLNAPTKQAFE